MSVVQARVPLLDVRNLKPSDVLFISLNQIPVVH